ncbi:UPF0547 protein C16orf87 homolog [Diretmus argenteus]
MKVYISITGCCYEEQNGLHAVQIVHQGPKHGMFGLFCFPILQLFEILLVKLDPKRRRTERIRRDRIDSPLTNDMENRRRSRSNSQSDPIRRGRGRPKTVGLKKQEEEKEKQEKEVDIYASLSDEKAFVFSVALAEINRKILGQRLIL